MLPASATVSLCLFRLPWLLVPSREVRDEHGLNGGRHSGTRAGLAFSLNYAAPELLAAKEDGACTVTVDGAADMWALGVVAFELLSKRRTFAAGTPEAEIRDMLRGRLPLPWEQEEPRALRTLKHSVLQCLSRDAALRPTAAQVAGTWRNLLDFAAVKHTEVAA